MRSRPSTTWASLPKACRLSRVLALVTVWAVRAAMRLSARDPVLAAADSSSASSPATSICEYQTSRVDNAAKRTISRR